MKRWWGIRHYRWAVKYTYLAGWWLWYGRHRYLLPNPADLKYLDLVWKGER